MNLCPELREILTPAMAPCASFEGVCKGHCKWQPKDGHIPRGFCGGTGAVAEVRLVLVTAEPGPPADGESYSGDAQRFIEQTAGFAATYLRDDSLRRNGRPAPYHRNLQRILDLCWPGLPSEERLRRTWITDAVLCTAKKSPRGEIDPQVEAECGKRYLVPQIAALPHAFVIALGGDAERRMRQQGIKFHSTAQHPSAWGTNPETSWERAAKQFRNWLEPKTAENIVTALTAVEAQSQAPGTTRKEWKKARAGTKRQDNAEILIANEGKPMKEVMELIIAKNGCGWSAARHWVNWLVENGYGPMPDLKNS